MKRHCKEFAKLQKKWYKKLKEIGFDDLETFDGKGNPHDLLKARIEQLSENKLAQFDKIQNFYSECRGYYHKAIFLTEEEKDIWAMYSEGYSMRQISDELGVNRHKVSKIVNIHINLMFRMDVVRLSPS